MSKLKVDNIDELIEGGVRKTVEAKLSNLTFGGANGKIMQALERTVWTSVGLQLKEELRNE